MGKVRDIYSYKNTLIMVCTDRQSGFDRLLGTVPFKGQVLSALTAFWYKRVAHLVKNPLVAYPDPNVLVVRKCKVFPIEFVVRRYITGTTATSLWSHYAQGARTYCGIRLPEGLRKNQPLRSAILTPTTKDAKNDHPINPEDILSLNLMTKEQLERASMAALSLFAFGEKEALKRNLILVDTKYEFGVDEQTGEMMIVDEVHTPDSSRFWHKKTYLERFTSGREPENFDKEFFRLWFAKHCNPYIDKHLPRPPASLIKEMSLRYLKHYAMMTGQEIGSKSQYMANTEQDIQHRIQENVDLYIQEENAP